MDVGVFIPPLGSSTPTINGDRFIPNRAAIDMGFAHGILTTPRPREEERAADSASAASSSSSRESYRRLLAEALMGSRPRILAFRNTPIPPNSRFLSESSPMGSSSRPRMQRCISQTPDRTLDAPDLVADYRLNLVDWGSANVLAIALGNAVYLWNASGGSVSELVTVDDDAGPVTSVSWAPDGQRIAVGLANSRVQLWDSSKCRLLRTLRGVHRSRVGSLAWNNNILTAGGMDGEIANYDDRRRSHAVHSYRGHTQGVCGLKWSGSGKHLASGGNDCLVHLWDLSMASSVPSPGQNQWLHRFDGHLASVKALAWCPFQSNLLSSGGGGIDGCIKFWNTGTGACLNSLYTGAQVCSLLWNMNERELLSSHGSSLNQMILWKYPSMAKVAELAGHTASILFMAQSPDGRTVASAGDEALMFWSVFVTPEATKPASPFSRYNHISDELAQSAVFISWKCEKQRDDGGGFVWSSD